MSGKNLACEGCGRTIPPVALWTAWARRAKLSCSECKWQVTSDFLFAKAEESEYTKTLVVTYTQLVRFGWTSAEVIAHAGVTVDPRDLGGILTGLQRAGLIQRVGTPPREVQIDLMLDSKVEPNPVFVPGPRFPMPNTALAKTICKAPPSVEAARRGAIKSLTKT